MRSNPYQEEHLRRGALHYLLGRGAAGLAGLVTVVLLVRCMDLRNYAVYTALSGVVSVCGVLAGMGMERILARYTPEGRLYHSAADLARFIWTCSAVRLAAVSLMASLVYLGWPRCWTAGWRRRRARHSPSRWACSSSAKPCSSTSPRCCSRWPSKAC
jgi:pyruvyl transferase EpsO